MLTDPNRLRLAAAALAAAAITLVAGGPHSRSGDSLVLVLSVLATAIGIAKTTTA